MSELVDKNIQVAQDIHLIALVSDKPGTLELRELSLAITPRESSSLPAGSISL
jgi:7,8-dihydropterin-6-yl-methyl-4-(beta-D-ribofuranosyl)aminobenzene 5'-phosphate synthase